MSIRNAAKILLTDAQMALRSGSWIVSTFDPTAAIAVLDIALITPASDEDITDAVDDLYTIMGAAMMAGELMIEGFEQFELADIYPELVREPAQVAANDDMQLDKAA